jgi:hypothetical protein
MKNRAPLEVAEVIKKRIANDIIKKLPPGWGFSLILSSFGAKVFSTYINNCKREGMIENLKELIDHLEKE